MKPLKPGFTLIVVASVAAAWVALCAQAEAQTNDQIIQIGDFSLDLTTAQPLPTNDIQISATFFSLTNYYQAGGSPAPMPFDPFFPWAPVYILGTNSPGGIWYLINDCVPNPADAAVTNAPPINWPVTLSDLTLVQAQDVPIWGTFYMYQDQFLTDPPNPPPYPSIPDFAQGAAVYSLGIDGVFVVDDTGLVRPAPQIESMAIPQITYPANTLYLSITSVSNYVAALVLHGTQPGTNYDIEYKQNLADSAWGYVGTITGQSNQNWTPIVVPVGDISSLFFWAQVTPPPTGDLWLQVPPGGLAGGMLTVVINNTVMGQPYDVLTSDLTSPVSWNVQQSVPGAAGNSTTVQVPANGDAMFVKVRFAGDSQGTGIPDWWWLNFLGFIGDPYADPDGDGWSNLQEYLNGTDPTKFNTPPPPQSVTATLDTTGTNVIVTWASGGGPVTNYVIESGLLNCGNCIEPVGQVNSSTFTFSIIPSVPLTGTGFDAPIYRVRADFSDGSSAVSQDVTVFIPRLTLDAQIVRGTRGLFYLAVPALPPSVSRIHFFPDLPDPSLPDFTIDASNIVNGVAVLSAQQIQPFLGSWCWVQAVSDSGTFGDIRPVFFEPQEQVNSQVRVGFVNASSHLKENLKFLLRSATLTQPFSYNYGGTDPLQSFGRSASPTAYEYYGYHFFSQALNSSVMNEIRPVQENFLWQNFVYNSQDFDSRSNFVTGAGFDGNNLIRTLSNPIYQYTGPGTETPLPLAFTVASSSWLFFDPAANYPYDMYANPEVGISLDSNTKLDLAGSVQNCYGLTLNSLEIGESHLQQPPSIFSPTSGVYFPNFASPILSTVGYYFVSQTPYFINSYGGISWYGTNYPAPPLPGSPTFSVASTSPLLIAAVGQQFTVSGWAKQQIGSSAKYAYLEQYFTNAYSIDANGKVTVNAAGILSPYGEFFPTIPGPAALVTMPDIDTGQRGTATVYCVSLALDDNHDGTMDLSFGGPDNTSQTRPMEFWVNNDNDGTGVGADTETNSVNRPDYQYGKIRSRRNLEDFARLWICGLPKLPTTSGYTITLSMSPLSGNPAINLYAVYGTNSGPDYLSNTNVARAQFTQVFVNNQLAIDYSQKLTTINSGQSYTLPVNTDGTPQYTNFLFEGAGSGAGQLTLTISQTTAQGSNVIAQTSAWLDLHDVRDFYERMAITNIFDGQISTWTSRVETIEYPVLSTDDDTNLIVLVHGINVGDWDWLQESDTVFKRLYWAGYRGKFATVKWPCNFLTPPNIFDPSVFNRSELSGYKSSVAIKTYLSQLRTRYPGYHLSIFAHSQGNSVVSEAIKQGAPFDTYILTQGALPASCYDANARTNTTLLNREYPPYLTPDGQPMGYQGVYTNFPGKIVSFCNIVDGVLNIWTGDQILAKPSQFYSYDGTNCWYLVDSDLGLYRKVTDTEESRSMIARSRTWAIGAQLSGGPTEGVIRSTVDLFGDYGFGDALAEHSAQWTRPIQTSLPYYYEILNAIQP